MKKGTVTAVLLSISIILLLIILSILLQNFTGNKSTQITLTPNSTIDTPAPSIHPTPSSPETNTNSTAKSSEVLSTYANLSQAPRNLINDFLRHAYTYKSNERKYWEGTDEYLSPEFYEKYKPASANAPSEETSNTKVIVNIFECINNEVYIHLYSDTNCEALVLTNYTDTVGAQKTTKQDILKLKVSKSGNKWKITNIDKIDTIIVSQ